MNTLDRLRGIPRSARGLNSSIRTPILVAFIDLADVVRLWRDAECTAESPETNDYVLAAMAEECAGDTHDPACPVAIARQAMLAAYANLEAIP